MNPETIKMTISQFADLHGINKRTLHYYDNIGLFSPQYKGENDYRYYGYLQGMDLEYIRMLKDLKMSIREIKAYMDHPNEEAFLEIADTKLSDIDTEIQKLKKTKQILQRKRKQLRICREIQNKEIRIVECDEERLITTPYYFENNDIEQVYSHIRTVWNAEQYCMGIGSYISVNKVRKRKFEEYDGLYTIALKKSKCADLVKPKGTYLIGYLKGDWEQLDGLYEEMLQFAENHHMELTGYAYEMGINDFAISSLDEYVTQVMIKADASVLPR